MSADLFGIELKFGKEEVQGNLLRLKEDLSAQKVDELLAVEEAVRGVGGVPGDEALVDSAVVMDDLGELVETLIGVENHTVVVEKGNP